MQNNLISNEKEMKNEIHMHIHEQNARIIVC